MKQHLELVCAFCGTVYNHETYSELPREQFECTCGATATLTVSATDLREVPIRNCEWSFEPTAEEREAMAVELADKIARLNPMN